MGKMRIQMTFESCKMADSSILTGHLIINMKRVSVIVLRTQGRQSVVVIKLLFLVRQVSCVYINAPCGINNIHSVLQIYMVSIISVSFM